ncbi:MAG: SEL1-like repeat protein [Zoogloeaceae bacterium]|jgi:TPR repeat protein|nr:SEL1-like repeat protein [Zoogloeaceae bacterium]
MMEGYYPQAQYALGEAYAKGLGVARDDAEAVQWYQKAAEQGHINAQYDLGWRYSQGQGVARNDAEAVKWYRRAAEQGNADAQRSLGEMYEQGRGVAQDEAEAVKWYREAAEQGDDNAQYNLGLMYRDGRGVARNNAEAVKWFRRAAWPYTSYRRRASDMLEAMKEWIQKAAEQGNRDAQAALGWMYGNWNGRTVKSVESMKWYRRAAEQGDMDAQYWLGMMYQFGYGTEKDGAEAVKWFHKAAKQGHEKANKERYRYWGTVFDNRRYDVEAGKALLLTGADGGDMAAQYLLGEMYRYDLPDYVEAAKWWLRAAKQGDEAAASALEDIDEVMLNMAEKGKAEARIYLGEMYASGLGVGRDEAEAVKWWRKAAEQGSKEGMEALNQYWSDVHQRSYVEAVKWIQEAAEQGDAGAQYNFGVMYEKGQGVAQDKAEAVKWYTQAAEQGNQRAREALKAMKKK